MLVLMLASLLGTARAGLEEKKLVYTDPVQGEVERLYLIYLPTSYNPVLCRIP